MAKRWQAFCDVPLKSFWIEILAVEFLNQWAHRDKGKTFYDWMARDFFNYLVTKSNANLYSPGTYEAMFLGSGWLSKATAAHRAAAEACDDEVKYPYLAGTSWQKIFGADIPMGG